ncbi:hypothetical protein ACG7TL_001881 [Trametes sanguinea]
MSTTSISQSTSMLLDDGQEAAPPPWTKITAEMVFKDSNPNVSDDFRRDIALLSIAMNRRKDGLSTGADFGTSDGMHSDRRALLGHISTLLTTGHVEDRTAATVNAVTGGIDAQAGVISLVCADNEKMNPGVKSPGLVKCDITRERGKQLLEEWDAKQDPSVKYCFPSYVAEIGSILAYVWQPDIAYENRVKDAELRARLDCFVIRHAFWKMGARVNNMRNLWGKSPVAIIRQWYKNHAQSVKTSTVDFPYMRDGFAQFLARHNLLPVPDTQRTSFPISPANVDQWLGALEELLVTLDKTLAKCAKKGHAAPVVALKIYGHVLNLNDLLVSSLLARITTEGVCKELQTWYDDPAKVEKGKQKPVDQGTNVIQGQPEETLQAEQGVDDASLEMEDGENRVLHVRRYLQTITAWLTASGALIANKISAKSLDICVLRGVPELDISTHHVEDFLGGYSQQLKDHLVDEVQYSAAKEELDKGFQREFYVLDKQGAVGAMRLPIERLSLHAEAALMDLSWGFIQQTKGSLGYDAKLNHIFPEHGGDVVIGVSKKCCWCCHLLHTLLQEHAKHHPPPITYTLPGSHAAIYSWIPPAGIPIEVLKLMRDRLFAAFNHLVCSPVTLLLSNQSSPVASGTSYPALLDDIVEKLTAKYDDPEKA